MNPLVLVVDDEPLQRDIMQTILEAEGYETHPAGSGRDALGLVRKLHPDVVLTDLKMSGMDGLELLEAILDTPQPPAVIIVTAHGTISSAVEAVRRGAFDYMTKPLEKDDVLLTVRKACRHIEMQKENFRLRQQLFDRFSMDGIVGGSPRMVEIADILKRVSNSSATVMIRGESGTGKELVARAIHYNSPRKSRSFTALNCAAIPESLFESELFGHEPGAFTGAIGRREGLIEATTGGTLFLDEVGDLPMTMQSKLLRVLQDREIRRIGAKDLIRVDIRILSATNKDLEAELEKGTFREDLYYRLNVVSIKMPPLRERLEDIPALVERFLHDFNSEFGKRVRQVAPSAMKVLMGYRWPGNVRQLQSVIERAVLMTEGDTITLRDIPELLQPKQSDPFSKWDIPAEGLDFEALERDLIQKAMTKAGGVATRAAKLLRMNYKAFLYRMEKFDIRERPEDGCTDGSAGTSKPGGNRLE